MPIVKKGEKRTGERQPAPEAKRKKSAKAFRQFSSVGYRNDDFHTIFRSIPDGFGELEKLLCRYIGSFLNSNGGILCFGARPNGTVYGEQISRKEEDALKLTIDTVMKRFSPHVNTDAYRVSFVPVGDVHVERAWALVEIRVKPGERFEMYEDMNHEVYVRRGEKAYGPVTPHEIKEHTLRQLKQKLKAESSLEQASKKENKPVPKTSGDNTPENKKSDTTRVDTSQKPTSVPTATPRPMAGKKALKQASNARYKICRQWKQPSQASGVCPPPHCSHPQPLSHQTPPQPLFPRPPPQPPAALRPPLLPQTSAVCLPPHCSHPQPLFPRPPPQPPAALRPPPPHTHAPAVYQPTHYNPHFHIVDLTQDGSWHYGDHY